MLERVTRRRLAIAALVTALLLTAAIVMNLGRARAGDSGENAGPAVLVATKLIPRGTPGSIVATKRMYATVKLPAEEVEAGAVADPSYLDGRTAVVDITRGQQLTAANFAK